MKDVAGKVCILTSVHPVFSIRIFHKQAKSLAAAGYRVTLIAPHHREETVDGVHIIPLTKPASPLKRFLKTPWRVWRLAVKEGADIYHFHDPELIPAGLLLRMRGRPVIYDVHEEVAKQIKAKKWVPLRQLISVVYRAFELVACRAFPLVLAEASYAKVYPAGFRKVIVQNFPPLNMLPTPSGKKKREDTVCYLGGVSPLRGISKTIEALAILKRQGRAVRFDCIGPAADSYLQQLQEQVNEAGLKESVTFYGRLDAPEAYKIITGSRVGLAVLQPNPNYFESFPTKMFEYMALEIPAVVSNFPLYARTVREAGCGLAVDPRDPEAIAAAIAFLLDNEDQAAEMGRKGRLAVENRYNWAVEEKKLLALYGELLARS